MSPISSRSSSCWTSAPRGVTCAAIDGILEEGKEIMTEAEDPDTRDAGMIAAAQAVEHYEITRYGTLIAWANQLGKTDVVKLLAGQPGAGVRGRPQAHRPRAEGAEPRSRLGSTRAARAAIR